MVHGTQGMTGTQALHLHGGTGQQEGVQEQTGKRSIGDYFVSFFKAIGNALAAPFRAIANALQAQPKHGEGGEVGKKQVGSSSTFTSVEKQQLLEEAFSSDFYKEVLKGGPVSVEQFESSARAILETPETVKAMKKHGVSLTEAIAISCYTSQSYVAINGQLRSDNPHPAATALAEAFNSGLSKLPSFEGTVYRGARLPESVGLSYQEGNMIGDQGIVSTTWDPKQKFTDRINYDIQIVCKDGSKGKDISAFSDKPTENEVAFPTGTRFQVTLRTVDGHEDSPTLCEKHPPTMGDKGPPLWAVRIVMEEV